MPNEIIKSQYISLAKLLTLYQQRPASKALISATYKFCLTLFKAAKSDPDLIFSQPQLYKKQLTYSHNLTFNACVNTCLLGIRNQLDESVTLQLMCATINMLASEQDAINTYYIDSAAKNLNPPSNNIIEHDNLAQYINKSAQQLWLSAWIISPYLHLDNPSKLGQFTLLQSINYIAIKLALLCTTNKRFKALKFALAFKQICLQSPAHWGQYLAPLIKYPTLSPPGSFIKHLDGSLLIILSINQQGVVVKPIDTTLPKAKQLSLQCIEVQTLAQCYVSQPVNNLNKLSHWWNNELENFYAKNTELEHITPFKKRLSIQAAPPSLLVIQDQLNNGNTDISVIIKAIEKNSAFTQQLQQSATRQNKKKQEVGSIQHALAMLGYERTSYLLLEYSLLTRLTQEYFPLQNSTLIFSHLCASIAAQIAAKTKGIQAELASITTYFLLSRIFTLPVIRTINTWQTERYQDFNLQYLINGKDNDTLKKGGVMLAQAWQQNRTVLDALNLYDTAHLVTTKGITGELSYLLGLSLIIAKGIYFAPHNECTETQKYITAAQKKLELTLDDITEISQSSISNIAPYSPLYQ